MGMVRIEPGGYFKLHWHAETEHYLIVSGHGRFTIGTEEKDIVATNFPTLITIPGNVPHQTFNPGKEDLIWYYYFPEADTLDNMRYFYPCGARTEIYARFPSCERSEIDLKSTISDFWNKTIHSEAVFLFVQKLFQRRSSASYFIVSFLYLFLLFLRWNFGFHSFYTRINFFSILGASYKRLKEPYKNADLGSTVASGLRFAWIGVVGVRPCAFIFENSKKNFLFSAAVGTRPRVLHFSRRNAL